MTTLQQFAQSIIDDPAYRESVVARARAGTLSGDVELLLLELADGRLPMSVARPVAAPRQSKTFALTRLSAPREENEDRD